MSCLQIQIIDKWELKKYNCKIVNNKWYNNCYKTNKTYIFVPSFYFKLKRLNKNNNKLNNY